jgi:glycosyltransferase involved in cell wall biosynthesis
MVNYNMAETLETSISSILDQVTEQYEVLVVDGGSSDESLAVLDRLSDEYLNLRYITLDADPNRRLGQDRQIAIESARGDYVIFQVDCDDRYHEVICDFVEVYHQVEEGTGFDFVMKGCAISMAPRELITEAEGFRNVGRKEDQDLWRRLFNRNAIIWLDHKPFWESIGYDDTDILSQFQNLFDEVTTDVQVGLSVWKLAKWLVRKGSENRWAYVQLVLLPLAYMRASMRESYTTPERYRDPRFLFQEMKKARKTFKELAEHHGFDIDHSALSDRGRDVFFIDISGYNYRGVGIDLVDVSQLGQ